MNCLENVSKLTKSSTSMNLSDLVKGLNEPQKKAVEHFAGPLLILAGAGSGKTRVLTHRMANLIASGKAACDEILCVTFTNKAAREMESRIYNLLSQLNVPVDQNLWVSTFHSFCVRILRQHITFLDYKPFFTIYDSSDQLTQIKKVLAILNINDKMFPPKSFQSRISSAKMAGLTPQDLVKGNFYVMDPKSLEVYTRYEEEMKRANCLDFDDLLMKTYELFKMYPDLLEAYRNKFKYVMVDEYQDTNHIQYLLIKSLAVNHRNICVVGDEDQSIYSWRGADIKNILDFEKDFGETTVVKLEENYRSTKTIVDAATNLIKNNLQRKDKTLFTSNNDGEKIIIREERSEYDEARFVALKVDQLIANGEFSYNDIAVFYRTNAQSRVLEEQLRLKSTPYRLIGGTRFYERMEIKDVIAYMKVALNEKDDIALKRIINVPTRGIGKTSFDKVEEFAAANRISFFESIQKLIDTQAFNSGTTSKLRRFMDLLSELKSFTETLSPQDFYHVILDKTEYLKVLKAENTTESESRIQNLEEFDNALAEFIRERGAEGSLVSFLEEMALVSDQDSIKENANSVTLMTLHISKGLEFPVVFIVGLEENLFPSGRGSDSEALDDLEEERRLAYVGMTRARKSLFLTYAKTRKLWGQDQMNAPSRFLAEIPKELVDHQATTIRSSVSSIFKTSNAFTSPKSVYAKSSFEKQTFPDDDFDDEDDQTGIQGKKYAKGMKVRHPTFGLGNVYSTEGNGEDLKVSVIFSDQTIKKFVVKFARLEIV